MTTRDPGLVKPPTHCSCWAPGSLTQIEVVHIASNRVRAGAFSQFGDVKGPKRKLVLYPEYQFRRWIVECWDCKFNTQQGRLAV